MTVVVVVPFVIGYGLTVGGVMAEAHVTEMVGNSEAVVDQLVLLALLSTEDEFAQIKAFEREIDKSVQLGSTDSEAILALAGLETFESND
jgi:hypothetical protein